MSDDVICQHCGGTIFQVFMTNIGVWVHEQITGGEVVWTSSLGPQRCRNGVTLAFPVGRKQWQPEQPFVTGMGWPISVSTPVAQEHIP